MQVATTMTLTPRDHALALAKAGLNAVPVVGGPLASLIGDYVPTSQQESMAKCLRSLSNKLEELEDRMDVGAIKKEDFAELFMQFQQVIERTNREEKLFAASNILVNFLLAANDPGKSSFEELDFLMHCLSKLSIGAIATLGAFRTIAKPVNYAGGTPFDELLELMPGRDPAVVMALVMELHSLNLVHTREAPFKSSGRSNVTISFTAVGLRFVERFIEGRM